MKGRAKSPAFHFGPTMSPALTGFMATVRGNESTPLRPCRATSSGRGRKVEAVPLLPPSTGRVRPQGGGWGEDGAGTGCGLLDYSGTLRTAPLSALVAKAA